MLSALLPCRLTKHSSDQGSLWPRASLDDTLWRGSSEQKAVGEKRIEQKATSAKDDGGSSVISTSAVKPAGAVAGSTRKASGSRSHRDRASTQSPHASNRGSSAGCVVEPLKLESYNISPIELINTVNLNNKLIAAGALDTGHGRFAVKVPGLFETANDVLDLPIKVSANGNGVVTLRDLTTVRRTFKDPKSFARLNGEKAVAIEITKRVGTNLIENNTRVKYLVNTITSEWPEAVNVTYSQDKMLFIKIMLIPV